MDQQQAISFNAMGQRQQQQQQVNPMDVMMNNLQVQFQIGLRELCSHCASIYQRKPEIERRPRRSFLFDGGLDPLDFILIFRNEGLPQQGIPRHWHYIGLGLSDIYGYSRIYHFNKQMREQNPYLGAKPLPELYPDPPEGIVMNGFGLELTLRLKCNSNEEWAQEPPNWPANLMQKLARYVFQSRNVFSDGDHVAWHCPLDDENSDSMDTSMVRHILMTLDPQLREAPTSLGPVKFIQIVGICQEELQAAREWNVRGILEMMREREETGGPFLVTDMRRCETIFDLNLDNMKKLEDGIRRSGSNMAQISGKNKTSPKLPVWFIEVERLRKSREEHGGEVNNEPGDSRLMMNYCDNSTASGMERGNLLTMNQRDDDQSMPPDYPVRTPSRMSMGSESSLRIENAEFNDAKYYENIYILLDYEQAKVLPIMLNGRLAHRAPFSFQSFKGDSLITFIPEGNPTETLVGPEIPFARKCNWLQIYVSTALREQMLETIGGDFAQNNDEMVILPKNYSWSDFNLHLTIVEEITDD